MKKIILFIAAIATGCASLFAITPASYPGGKEAMDKYLSENLKYPSAAKQNSIEGVVNVAFIVNPDGSIGSIKIVRMIDPDLENEAIRLVKGMPSWVPASDNGVNVESSATVSIPFILPSE